MCGGASRFVLVGCSPSFVFSSLCPPELIMPGSRVRVPPLLLSKSSSPKGLGDFVLSGVELCVATVPTTVPSTPKLCPSSAAAACSHRSRSNCPELHGYEAPPHLGQARCFHQSVTGRPKLLRMRATLLRNARATLGPESTELDYIVDSLSTAT